MKEGHNRALWREGPHKIKPTYLGDSMEENMIGGEKTETLALSSFLKALKSLERVWTWGSFRMGLNKTVEVL